MTFGNRLRAARIAAGVSQAAVGLALDPVKYRSSITRYEGGQDEPSLSTIEQLAAALGVTPCWLAFGCEHKTGHDK